MKNWNIYSPNLKALIEMVMALSVQKYILLPLNSRNDCFVWEAMNILMIKT